MGLQFPAVVGGLDATEDPTQLRAAALTVTEHAIAGDWVRDLRDVLETLGLDERPTDV